MTLLYHGHRYFLVIDDVWEIQSWETIKLAFVENNRACRIIATTRNHEVARKAGQVYKMQPLSDDNSRKLFFARVFSGESKSSDYQSDDDVSGKILRKCGGIPLAIITMASLLVDKPMDEWSEVHRSIGFANKENQQVENTEKILSFSYYDLPSHLRTCLLYLSVFPEDYFIEKSTLVWMWIAEGFVEEKQGMSSFEIGEGYFNELVNRSMIQQVEKKFLDGAECGCQVHDMVLDLIRSISSEENFVTILGNNNELGSRVRRLSLQNNRTMKAHTEMQLVRSFISWPSVVDKGISPSSFKLLRVLSLQYAYSTNEHHQQLPLRNLLHLRYLMLRVPNIVLPAEEMGSLKFLQTLDLGGHVLLIYEEVAASIGLLTKLLCLRFRYQINTVPDGIGKLAFLEELHIHCSAQEVEPWRQFVNEVCGLKKLRVLSLYIHYRSRDLMGEVEHDDMVLKLLRNLQKLEILSLGTSSTPTYADAAAWEAAGFLLPRRLRQLCLGWISFSRFPSLCINPSRLPHLSRLSLHVDAMDEQDLRILGKLPHLSFLYLVVHNSIAEVDCNNNTTTDDDGCCLFRKLRSFTIWYYEGVRFLLPSQEASGSRVLFSMHSVRASMQYGSEREDTLTLMPSVQKLSFAVYVQEFIKDGNHNNDCISLALDYFGSLQNVHVNIYRDGASSAAEVDQVEAALRRAADAHPNRPRLELNRWNTSALSDSDSDQHSDCSE
jgi:disease resistance protein RPM1